MKFGETYKAKYINRITGEVSWFTETYRYTPWHEYHTDDEGDGLWCDGKQILGTCQFTVRGCKTEKAAIAKIRRYVMM